MFINKKIYIVIALFIVALLPTACSQSKKDIGNKADTQQAKQVDMKKQEQIFNDWLQSLNLNVKEVDDNWQGLWVNTLNGLSNKSIDIYTAYSNIVTLENKLERPWRELNHLEPPKGLSEEHQEKLEEAAQHFGTWAYCRRNACKLYTEMLNQGNFSPQKVNEVKEEINSGDALMMQGWILVNEVKADLGIKE